MEKINWHKAFLLSLLFLLMASPLSAQWKAGISNIRLRGFNTQMFLNFNPGPGLATGPYFIEIVFRRAGTRSVVHRKELQVAPKTLEVFPVLFSLPQGEYEVDIDFLEESRHQHTLKQLTYTCRYDSRKLSSSDIFLSYEPFEPQAREIPLLEPVLLPEKGEVYYMMEIYAPGYSQVTVEAILLEAKSQDYPSAVHYQSLQKSRQVLPVANGMSTLRGVFDISNLREGAYLIQVVIPKQGDEGLNLGTPFRIEGYVTERVMANIDESVQMMAYVLPQNKVLRMIQLPNPEQKRDTLVQAWKTLYPERPEEAMEDYFRRMYTFVDSLATGEEDWRCDRARIFTLYGKPDQGFGPKGTFTYQGDNYLRWTYSHYELSFTFKKRNNRYILLE